MADLESPGHESPVEVLIEDVEKIFSPRPGGLVEKHREERARREAAAEVAANAAVPVTEPTFKAVKVVILAPEITATNQVSIPAGGTAMILPYNPQRKSAFIVTSANIILAKDQSQALGQVGFPLTAANGPFPVNSRAQLWAFAAGATVVNTYAESYDAE